MLFNIRKIVTIILTTLTLTILITFTDLIAVPDQTNASSRSSNDALDYGNSFADADKDRIPDEVEIIICASTTCLKKNIDTDNDGIGDWVEYKACRSIKCANPDTDTDADGIPDFAELLTCNSIYCTYATEDADIDSVPDWVEFVICGDRICANGTEDYNTNRILDAAELNACVKVNAKELSDKHKINQQIAVTGSENLQQLFALISSILLLAGISLLIRKKASKPVVLSKK